MVFITWCLNLSKLNKNWKIITFFLLFLKVKTFLNEMFVDFYKNPNRVQNFITKKKGNKIKNNNENVFLLLSISSFYNLFSLITQQKREEIRSYFYSLKLGLKASWVVFVLWICENVSKLKGKKQKRKREKKAIWRFSWKSQRHINVFLHLAFWEKNRRKKRKISNKIIIIPKGSISLSKFLSSFDLSAEWSEKLKAILIF